MADLDLSIRAELVAITVTPGRMAPLASLTVPLIALCASAARDAISSEAVRTSDVHDQRPALMGSSHVIDHSERRRRVCGSQHGTIVRLCLTGVGDSSPNIQFGF